MQAKRGPKPRLNTVKKQYKLTPHDIERVKGFASKYPEEFTYHSHLSESAALRFIIDSFFAEKSNTSDESIRQVA